MFNKLQKTVRRSAPKAGFTLVEVMVSVSIFALVVTTGIGALLLMHSAYRNSRVDRIAIDNLNFTIDSLAREIRTGYDYFCGESNSLGQVSNCPSGASSFTFTDKDTDRIWLHVLDGALWRRVSGVDVPLTGSDISIQSVRFFVTGAGIGDGLQPRLTMVVEANVNQGSGGQQDFVIQTSVSQRSLDVI